MKKILLSLVLIGISAVASAGVLKLHNPPAPSGFPPFSLTTLPGQYPTGVDADGNFTGVVHYYANGSGGRGNPGGGASAAAFVTWSVLGEPLSAVPCSLDAGAANYCAPFVRGLCEAVLEGGGRFVFCATASSGGYRLGIIANGPTGMAVILTP